MTADDFLDDTAIAFLTGYKQKRKQIDQLRRMGVAFRINAAGQPVVARAIIEGNATTGPARKTWEPSWAVGPRST